MTDSIHLVILVLYQTSKCLDLSELKAVSDNNLHLTYRWKFALGRVENISGKGENVGYQHFLLFLQCFLKPSFLGVVKSQDCIVKGLINV